MEELHQGQVCIFTLDGEYYALDAQAVRAVQPCGHITYVPGCPPEILGVMHIKGKVEAVADLGQLLGRSPREPGMGRHLLMISQDHLRAGLLVDSVEDITEVPPGGPDKLPQGLDEAAADAASGVCGWKDNTVVILDHKKIMERLKGASR